MAVTLMDKEQRRLLKKYHTLCGKAGIDDSGKAAILVSYGVESSKDLSAYELLEICNKLDKELNPKVAEMDRWRKRVIASIFAYFSLVGIYANMDKVKGTAVRAASAKNFNSIPLEKLRSLYYAFNNKGKLMKNVDAEVERIVREIKGRN